MKNRNFWLHHEEAIIIAIIIAILVACFTIGFLVSWNFLEKPLSNEQFMACEKVAQDVYSQKKNVIVEVPEDYTVSISATIISVALRSPLYRGKIFARLKNSELVTERYFETEKAIVNSCAMGLLFIIAFIFVFIIIVKIKSGN